MSEDSGARVDVSDGSLQRLVCSFNSVLLGKNASVMPWGGLGEASVRPPVGTEGL